MSSSYRRNSRILTLPVLLLLLMLMPLISEERNLLSVTQCLLSIFDWHLNNLFILSAHWDSSCWHRAILLIIYRGEGLRVLHIIRLIKEHWTALSVMVMATQIWLSYSSNSICLLTNTILFLKVQLVLFFNLECWAIRRRISIKNVARSSTRWDFADWAVVSGRSITI